jgi:hypothetical protein
MTDDNYTVAETVLLNHIELTADENAELVARPHPTQRVLTKEQAALRLSIGQKVWDKLIEVDDTLEPWSREAYTRAPPWKYYVSAGRLRRVFGALLVERLPRMRVMGFTKFGGHEMIDGVAPDDLHEVEYENVMTAVDLLAPGGADMHWFTDPLGFLDAIHRCNDHTV